MTGKVLSGGRPLSLDNFPLEKSCINPCPYVSGRFEQQLFALLQPGDLDHWADKLNQLGFRRSMHCVYMPDCPNCQACQSVRVRVGDFQPGKSLRRIWSRNADLRFACAPNRTSPEKFALFQQYLRGRHPESDMNIIDEKQFRDLTEIAPGKAYSLLAYEGARLVGVMMVDDFSDGYSAVYSYFALDQPKRSLGVLLVLKLLELARASGKAYVYLGYYIAEASNMAYKARFGSLERFDWSAMCWHDFPEG